MVRRRASFLTGPAVVLPGVITLAVVKWLFGSISSIGALTNEPAPLAIK